MDIPQTDAKNISKFVQGDMVMVSNTTRRFIHILWIPPMLGKEGLSNWNRCMRLVIISLINIFFPLSLPVRYRNVPQRVVNVMSRKGGQSVAPTIRRIPRGAI